MNWCLRCGSKNIELLPSFIQDQADFEQYHCNDCMYDFDNEEDK